MNHNSIEHRSYRFLTMIVMIVSLLVMPLSVYAGVTDDSNPEWRGLIEARPTGSVQGEWVVGGRTFTADGSTQIEEEHGALAVGVCAEVKYHVVADGYTAVKIERKESGDCGGNDGGGDNGGGDNGGGDNGEQYGRIETMPAGNRAGSWTIGGILYQADANTQFGQEHGGFAVGACVNVHTQGNPTVVTKIETEHDYKCDGSGNDNGNDNGGGNTSPDHTGELYGLINTLPATLLGEWTIGTMSILVDGNTRLEQEHGAFAVGMLVEVKFTTDSNNIYHATKIESKYATEHDGNDDNGNGSHDGNDGHLYGKVEAMPTGGTVGTWTIAGLTYTATAATRIEQEHGALTIGTNVKIEYYVDANGNRVATKIESTTETGNITDPAHANLYGFVQAMPNGSFNGTWVINGVTVVADNGTLFQETHGLLAVGAYVEVETMRISTETYAVKLETQVPPGAGVHNHGGEIESNSLQAAMQQQSTATTWTIGGQSFLVTPATDLNDGNVALTVGNSAIVNSYTNADGQEVATQIRGIVFTTQLYVPLIVR